MHLALSRQPCVRSLYENQDVSDDKTYSELKNGMQEAIADVYHTGVLLWLLNEAPLIFVLPTISNSLKIVFSKQTQTGT